MIPRLDAAALDAGDPGTLEQLRLAAEEIGFLTLENTTLCPDAVQAVLAAYRTFFHAPEALKSTVDMAVTGSTRGWGRGRAEQVDPGANPDYKEVFDIGFELPEGDPLADRELAVYAPNRWPAMAGFREVVEPYGAAAMQVADRLLAAIACAIGAPETHFARAFARPMAMLRGNFYPPRPGDAGDLDYGIAPHTDYGCLTLLATDGQPGLDVQMRDGSWAAVQAEPGVFVINFGEMLEMWTGGRVRATPHRVIGAAQERLSVPLFFNPSWDWNVAPVGAAEPVLAGPYLSQRYAETYMHLRQAS